MTSQKYTNLITKYKLHLCEDFGFTEFIHQKGTFLQKKINNCLTEKTEIALYYTIRLSLRPE